MEKLKYVSWYTTHESDKNGRKGIRYYLKKMDGTSDLEVIGKDMGHKNLSYRYVNEDRSGSTPNVLRSRREVIDWMNSKVEDSAIAFRRDIEKSKDIELPKMGHYSEEFVWFGSSWTCKKERNHYQSFSRNGVKITVHDFIFVLAEENKRLVAYLEDMYEDCSGNKMVLVRWFHKIDEVGIVFNNNFNDREIFFSLCLQDLSVECIDGLATILNPQHFEKFLKEATHTQLEPYLCHRQFESDDLKPFDITQVKGYWKQEILRFMYTSSPEYSLFKPPQDEEKAARSLGFQAKMKLCRYLNGEVLSFTDNSTFCKDNTESCAIKEKSLHYLTIGSEIEVLSQDSGIKGCWFSATIVKKHKDKLKVRYLDIQDADDGANKLEEWLLASRVAACDVLGLRTLGRNTIRPSQQSNKSKISWAINIGCVVDVQCHDGWWEGIVIQKESEDKFHVYFPGEKWESFFCRDDMRQSREWLGNCWEHVKDRPDLVAVILSDGPDQTERVIDETVSKCTCLDIITEEESPVKDEFRHRSMAQDLLKDDSLSQLKWKTSRKRKFGYGKIFSKPETQLLGSKSEDFLISKAHKVDRINCKYVGKSHFGSSFTSLVMSS